MVYACLDTCCSHLERMFIQSHEEFFVPWELSTDLAEEFIQVKAPMPVATIEADEAVARLV